VGRFRGFVGDALGENLATSIGGSTCGGRKRHQVRGRGEIDTSTRFRSAFQALPEQGSGVLAGLTGCRREPAHPAFSSSKYIRPV